MVGSTASLLGLIGYAAYAPPKFAVKGLAECLRAELFPHDISVHLFLPMAVLTPGYEEENKYKPKVLKWVEESDVPQTPQAVVKKLISGLEKDHFVITSDFMTDLLRSVNRGVGRGHSVIGDAIKAGIGYWALEGYFRYLEWGIPKRINKKN